MLRKWGDLKILEEMKPPPHQSLDAAGHPGKT